MSTKILIADDESDIVSMLVHFFESKGFAVFLFYMALMWIRQGEMKSR